MAKTGTETQTWTKALSAVPSHPVGMSGCTTGARMHFFGGALGPMGLSAAGVSCKS